MSYNRFYSCIDNQIKINAFNVLDYYSVNRKSFDGLSFSHQFRKLYDECKPILKLDDSDLAKAVDIVLTLEQQRMNSYSQGNTHIEDYTPAHVKNWREYME